MVALSKGMQAMANKAPTEKLKYLLDHGSLDSAQSVR